MPTWKVDPAVRDDRRMGPEPFGEIPLFRELQRLLSSSEGPVNETIASQVAHAIARQDPGDREPPADSLRAYGDSLREAELLLSGYTRLRVDEPSRPSMLSRSGWVDASLGAYKWLIDHFATRMTGSFDDEAGSAGPQQALMEQVVPLLMGLQAGTLIGHLALDALGRYDLPLPREDDGRLFLVYPNAVKVAEAYGFEPEPFRKWMALREMSRHLVMAESPWAARYLRSALLELIDSIEVDAGDIERRMLDLQERGVEALQGAQTDDVLPVVQTERHQTALRRLQSFVAILEGYGAHASGEVGAQIVPDSAKIAEGMARHDASTSEGKAALTKLLGLSLDKNLRSSGVTFCAAVVKLKGVGSLNKLWEAPDNLPTIEEIRDPFKWIERVLEQ